MCFISARSVVSGRLDLKEIQAAETAILRYVQKQCFTREVEGLESGCKNVPKSSKIYRLEPFRDDDGLLKVTGRLELAPVDISMKHPIILPKRHCVSALIVRHVHEIECGHFGTEYVLSTLRQKFWIVKARSLIKGVIRNCMTCKRLRTTGCQQRMADLPADRVAPGKPPFTNVGVDCFGLFLVKRGRSHEKRYGRLFTCLNVRAIHIEKLHSLDTDSFVNAPVRFVARRGTVQVMRSDNGTNFIGGEKELRGSIRRWNTSHQVHRHLLLKEIEWKFNPPAASHMGGIWERQIRTVCRALDVVMKGQIVNDELLDTMFCEVESMVNSRPLTPTSDDPRNLEALTPNHLLLLRPGLPCPVNEFTAKDAYRRRWTHVQYLADRFSSRWISEYLPTLQLHQKWLEAHRNLRVGDVVIIADENTPKRSWPLGRVTVSRS